MALRFRVTRTARVLVLALALIAGVAAFTAWAPGCQRTDATAPPTPSQPDQTAQTEATPEVETQAVTIAGRTFDLELALDDDTRWQGLSDREFIDPDGGMLFVFPRARRAAFVMRRCLVPIDIVFLGPNGRVITSYAMAVEPYHYTDDQLTQYDSRYPAQFVIELAGGTLETLDLKPGDAAELPVERLKARAR